MDITLLHRYLADECSEQERKAVEAWIDQSKQNKKYYESIVKIWEVRPKGRISFDTERAWNQLAEEVNIGELYDEETQIKHIHAAPENRKNISGQSSSQRLAESHFRQKSSGSMQVLLRIAAILLVGVGLGGILFMITQDEFAFGPDEVIQEEPKKIEFTADRGEDVEFEFLDGTSGTLHAGSTLKVESGYGQSHRQVMLDGQAFFQVVESDDLSFQVKTNEADIEVLGTSFNVASWSERAQSEIIVKTGSVGVRRARGLNEEEKEQVILEQNERVVVSDRSISAVERVDTDVYLSWLEGDIFFDEDSLEYVFKYLERRFDVNFVIEDEQEIMQKQVSARYQDESLQEILDITSVSHKLNFREENGRIIVSSASR